MQAVLIFTRQMALQDHEAETLFAGNAALSSKACKGTIALHAN